MHARCYHSTLAADNDSGGTIVKLVQLAYFNAAAAIVFTNTYIWIKLNTPVPASTRGHTIGNTQALLGAPLAL